ncbi:MAG: toprim domain-containing protein [Oscillospiraceae bacterium]|nr:toprim domain-containing protein [Oscillospiraceae bacterium]
MSFIAPDVVARAKQMDLYTYLSTYEPQELVHFGGGTYCTREHDSLKISNGKWYWFSRNIGGRSALDYLIKVRGIPFTEAVEVIVGRSMELPVISPPAREPPKRTLLLPEASCSNTRAVNYLVGRGIDRELIDFCIRTGRLYESEKYHNVVFVGQDSSGKPRYANLRGITSDFKGEASGSDKRYSFSIPAEGNCRTLHVFESAIDLLSFATMCKLAGRNWQADHMVSLAGVYRPRKELRESSLPLALTQYLHDHPGIRKIVLRLDNDYAGRTATQVLQTMLAADYEVNIRSPPESKDYNDCLCLRLGMPMPKTKARSAER